MGCEPQPCGLTWSLDVSSVKEHLQAWWGARGSKALKGGGRRTSRSRLSLAAKQVWGQPGLHEKLSQKTKNNYLSGFLVG